ncbi:MAG TPA: hypothetical protein VD886_17930 [Herpetosiphonaceae bacterium]|nr:hypothetical protein [Herpetosiphonaceae bacterium]
MKFVRTVILLGLLAPVLGVGQHANPGQAAPVRPPRAPVTAHPRLWLTGADLPRLRSWADASNPVYAQGLKVAAEHGKAYMDAPGIGQPGNRVPGQDNGGTTYSPYYTESYALLFSFMSLIEQEANVRADYAQRARTLLMYVMNRAVQGPAAGQPFRDPAFAVSDRSRWEGQAFALTVDWIYPILTAQDKATIRLVFLRWASENMNAYPNPSYFQDIDPTLVNDPALLGLDDPQRSALRFSANNYFMAHMRNNGLMAMALDEADDPGNQLRGYLRNATGAWLYMQDYMYRHDARGGLSPEGFEYMPSMAFPLQLLLALHTAGQDDPTVWGPQVVLADNPYWNATVATFLHSMSPVAVDNPDYGQVYQPAWYGDGERYFAPETIAIFGTLGVYDGYWGNAARLRQIRWLQTHTPPGGSDRLLNRARSEENLTGAILYFLIFDPTAAAAPDPRPALSLLSISPGLGRIMARTDWGSEARWFNYKLSWNRIDHQHADGNMFDFYRKGEWLTKERTGYGVTVASSDYKNTLAVQNNPPEGSPGAARYIHALRGSQFILGTPAGDPAIIARSARVDFVYALGDATRLYNSVANYPYTDVRHVSRSIVWLKPDYIVVYDRAETQTASRFKRFWLNLPNQPSLNGNLARAATDSGQQLFVTTLLPQNAQTTVVTQDATLESWALADYDPMRVRLRVEAPGGPASARFLHVLQGADAGAGASPTTVIQSSAGTAFQGALVDATAVVFPVSLQAPFTSLTYSVPAGTERHVITGLSPNSHYTVSLHASQATLQVQVTPGGAARTDGGGVLTIGMQAPGSVWVPLIQR